MNQFIIHRHHKTKVLQPRNKHDRYPTPEPLVLAALTKYLLPVYPRESRIAILDPVAGAGVWGKVARDLWPDAHIVGTEIDKNMPFHPAYNEWYVGNHIGMDFPRQFDLTIGNPPYGDLWEIEQTRQAKAAKAAGKSYTRPPRPKSAGPRSDAEAFIRKAYKDAAYGGLILFLFREALKEGQDRYRDLWTQGFCPARVGTCPKRPSFTGNSKTDATAYALYVWSNDGYRREEYAGGWCYWSDDETTDPALMASAMAD